MKLPDLSEEQAAALLAKKKAHAESQGKRDDACQNLKCRCVECSCGAACTCNVSPDVNCDECKEFKGKIVAGKNSERLAAAEAFYKENVAPKFEGMTTIRAAELKRLRDGDSADKVLLVDTRSEAERAVSLIPSSVSAAEFEADPEGLGKDKIIVAHCTIGGRSAAFCQKLQDMPSKPWAEVRNFELSLVDWCHAGFELVDSTGAATKRVHIFGPKMEPLFPVEGYELTM